MKLFINLLLLVSVLSSCEESKTNLDGKEIKLSSKVDSLKEFCLENEYNSKLGILVEFSIHSGKHRFFVVDLESDSILIKALVCHGSGKNVFASSPTFSNVPGSNCSSLGKYRIGKRSWSNYGIHVHYKLHGLEKTNDNAFKRHIVLHSYAGFGLEEIYPQSLFNSQGCPTVANETMMILDQLIKRYGEDIILWIYI